jgi:hypothetical protein
MSNDWIKPEVMSFFQKGGVEGEIDILEEEYTDTRGLYVVLDERFFRCYTIPPVAKKLKIFIDTSFRGRVGIYFLDEKDAQFEDLRYFRSEVGLDQQLSSMFRPPVSGPVSKIGDLENRVDAILKGMDAKTKTEVSPHLERRYAARVAASIRSELTSKGEIYRVVIDVSESLWKIYNEQTTSSRIRMLTSLPDDAALISLMGTFCSNNPGFRHSELSNDLQNQALTGEERTFLIFAARESMERWVSVNNPLRLSFHSAPEIHRVSMVYPAALVEFILAKLDAVP